MRGLMDTQSCDGANMATSAELLEAVSHLGHVRDAAALTIDLDGLETMLIALAADEMFSPPAVRFAASKCCGFSKPPAIAVVDSFPRKCDGLIDAMLLVETAAKQGRLLRYRPSGTDTEASLISALESILETSPVGTDDDFFLLGMDSLAAIQLTIAAEELAPSAIALEDIFECSTAARLALRIDAVARGPLATTLSGFPGDAGK
jgi:acyl carrier protein